MFLYYFIIYKNIETIKTMSNIKIIHSNQTFKPQCLKDNQTMLKDMLK